jgi:NADPH:quinone reductase-like Zn-dependent oxidoreductase
VQTAGIRRFGGDIEVLELPAPRALRSGEVLISVRAAGVANWDEYVRTGGWDTGARPPMALGVEATGIVTALDDAATALLAAKGGTRGAALVIQPG